MKNTVVLFFMLIGLGVIGAKAQVNLQINEINTLEVTDRIWVTVVPSDRNELQIEGELADKVETIITNKELRLKMKAGYYLKGNQASVIIYTPTVSKIIARKGAEVNFEEETLKNARLDIFANEGAKIRAKIDAKQVEVESNTGSVIDLLGTTEELTVNNTAGGSFFGKDLKAERALIRTNAGGKTEIYATESADVQTRAGGVIDVYGEPKQRTHKRIAGGKINFIKNDQTL